ncbi:oligosaccharide flippase family protein [Sporolactobacillus vineae]|uniref:oligosaccharide flippase family protein n=1 Tax=Sporolactobacillus vineae TaxID=444463 RepID=UPI000288608E|nr:oligosaccharide flippase family protein [Sporolactobacillus vineae]
MQETNKESRRIWHGAVVLTIAALLVKLMSAVYRMVYQNFAGDIGFYAYQQIYPFYAFAVAIGGIGFPIVLSKYIAEAEKENGNDPERVRRHGLIALILFCGVLFALLSLFAGPLTLLMGDPRLGPLLRTVSLVYLFVPFVAVLRGSFQGAGENMVPTACSQIAEQAVRVSLIIGLSWYLFLNQSDAYQFGMAAAAGSAAAPVAAFIVLVYFAQKHRMRPVRLFSAPPDWLLIREMLTGGCLFSVLAMPLFVFQLADALTVIPLLHQAHIPDPRASKGIYDRIYLLTQFGIIAATSLTASIVPGLARLAVRRKRVEMQRQARLAIRISAVFGLSSSVGLAVLSREVNTMLFRNDEGSFTFGMLAFTLLTLSLILSASGILESAGKPWLPFFFLLAGALLKLLGNYLLIPRFAISGAAAATLLATLLTVVLDFLCLRRLSLIGPLSFRKLIRLSAAIMIMAASVLLWRQWLTGWMVPSRLSATFIALSGTALGGLVFLILILFFHYFSPGDLLRLPLIGRWTVRSRKR